jgi:ABC-type taurine transport system substrate-binding protein
MKDDHKWAELAGSIDACVCLKCGMVASNSAIVAGVGVPTSDGWAVGEFAATLPSCDQVLEGTDVDAEFTQLLAGEFDE